MNEEFDNDFREENNRIDNLPVYKKALEIMEVVQRMLKGVEAADLEKSPQDDHLQDLEFKKALFDHSVGQLRANSTLIPAKIAGAEAAQLYDLRMENAAIIRKAAREIITDARGLQNNGFTDIEYLDLLRGQIEQFRPIFAEWIDSFDKSHYIIDRWNVFNPPGVRWQDEP